ncbi:MAG: dTDP-4-dehydrorhamnose reductase [Desulfuromonas sp.]|nr:MAG: dTDP-4-dehydrorhamnose reductase [Desulfuromonas sp.]
MSSEEGKRLLLFGPEGMLGRAIRRRLPAELELCSVGRSDCDITDRSQVERVIASIGPGTILNCAAMTDVDGCESKRELAMAVNGQGPANLVAAAKRHGLKLIHVSTDYVFPGESNRPISEEDPVGPVSVYGKSKLAGEKAILDSAWGNYLIVRTSWLYGLGGKNFVETMLRLAKERKQLRIVDDQVGSPTWTDDLAAAILRLLARDGHGLYHYANSGQCSWYGFAREIILQGQKFGLPIAAEEVLPIRTTDYPLPAPRPKYSVLSTCKFQKATGFVPPPWQMSLKKYLQQRLETGSIR